MINDDTRTLFMLVVTNAFAVAVQFHVGLSAEQVGAIQVLINSVTILALRFFRVGQEPGPLPPVKPPTPTSTPPTEKPSTPLTETEKVSKVRSPRKKRQ